MKTISKLLMGAILLLTFYQCEKSDSTPTNIDVNLD